MSEEKYASPVAQNYAPEIFLVLVLSRHRVNVQQREEEHIEKARNKQSNRSITKDVVMGLTGFIRATILKLL